jgi:hypothetical protein
VRIARSQLSAICRAIGVMQPRDSVDLHKVPLVGTVKVKKNSETRDLVNEVKGFEPKASVAPAPATPSNGGGATTPPWKR